MNRLSSFIPVLLLVLLCGLAFPLQADDGRFHNPQPVAIDGLPAGADGTPLSTEEPFVSRDGRFLFFNSGEHENHKDLYYAVWRDGGWRYQGEIGPHINTAKNVEGNPTMDASYDFYYIDSAKQTMARSGHFNPLTGQLDGLHDVAGIPEKEIKPFRSFQGNMGVEISADGKTLYFSRATWKMNAFWLGRFIDSDIFFAQRRDSRFIYDEKQARTIMQNINTRDMEYAASISADGLELFFTRLAIDDLEKGRIHSQIMRAARTDPAAPFGLPQPITAIGSSGFVEAPAIGPDGSELYYHKREGKKFRLYKVVRSLRSR